jgi:hypothetical protein
MVVRQPVAAPAMIHYQTMLSLAARINREQLDNVARLTWRGFAEGALTDTEAQSIATTIEYRRGGLPWQRAGAGSMAPPAARRRPFIR